MFSLSLESRKKNTNIVYTTDGSNPKEKSKNYINPIKITETTVVKAQVKSNGKLTGNVITKTYFIGHKSLLPVVSLTAEPRDLWEEPGIYKVNFLKRGSEWEIPAHLDFYETNGEKVIDMDLAMRMHGGTSRNQPQKSFRLCANELYGPKYINYKIFEDGQNYYRCLLFRNSGNDWAQTMMRDGVIQSFAVEIGLDAMRYRPAVLYINGRYFGIQNIREFFDEQYFIGKYGARTGHYTVVRSRHRTKGYPEIDIGKEGDEIDYAEMTNLIEIEGLQNEKNFKKVEKEIDLKNLTDYTIFQIFVGNHDWPQSNVKLWKLSGLYDENAKYGLDGRYRYAVFDVDHGFGYGSSFTENSLDRASNPLVLKNHPWSTTILEELFKNEDFRISFINRYADLLNTVFTYENLISRVEESHDAIVSEIPKHIERWEGSRDRNKRLIFENVEEWEKKVDVMREYVTERPGYAKQHVVEKFGLSGYSKVTVDVEGRGQVKINTLDFTSFPVELDYFNDIPVPIAAKPFLGYKFVGWEISNGDTAKESSTSIILNENIRIKAIFEKNLLGKILNL